MDEIRCPACGSDKIELKKDTITLSEAYAGERTIEVNNYICSKCDFEGDIKNENDAVIEKAQELLRNQAHQNIVEYLLKGTEDFHSVRLIDIERILGIPIGSLKNNDPIVLALLKFIRRFPWLLEIAEQKFDMKKTHTILMNNAYNEAQSKF